MYRKNNIHIIKYLFDVDNDIKEVQYVEVPK